MAFARRCALRSTSVQLRHSPPTPGEDPVRIWPRLPPWSPTPVTPHPRPVMNAVRQATRSLLIALVLLFAHGSGSALNRFGFAQEEAVPPGFVDELVIGGWMNPTGLTFDANGRMYVWEKSGVLFVVENGVPLLPPLIDIREEVGNWRDHGLLSVALDPDFLVNGYFYLFYVVDRHHLLNFGTPDYDPTENEYFNATIGRITRYTAESASGFTTTDLTSRLVLLGETADTGIPILYQSHGVGTLSFGVDGSLLASCGDGGIGIQLDTGSQTDTYWVQALADGIIRPEENVGAFRSQMIGALNGKVLRLDPATGDGLAQNPFYDSNAPRAARSRVWALGLRNPYRFSLRPGTGNPDPSAGEPGTIYLGDVGWRTWEELHVVDEPGSNLGWPLFEGLTEQTEYTNALTENLDAPNPLFDGLGCTNEFFHFQDLLKQDQKDHNPPFPNPCDPLVTIAPSTPTFIHHRAAIEWQHAGLLPGTRVPIFNGNAAATAVLGDPDSPAVGTPFNGDCATAGFWHSGVGFPAPYGGLYFAADCAQNWIRAFRFGPDNELEEVFDFHDILSPIFLREDPNDGSLIYIDYLDEEIRRIRFNGTFDRPPVVALEADRIFGPGPLTVQFDASASLDPEGLPLTFDWDFGNSTSTEPSPEVTFPKGDNPIVYTVQLTVTDQAGNATSETLDIHIDNSPPAVSITSIESGSFYSTTTSTQVALEADVQDDEDAPATLVYAWEVALLHSTHQHPEPIDTNPITSATLSPTPCTGEFFGYQIELKVTDPRGLTGSDRVVLYPDCAAAASIELVTPRSSAIRLPNQPFTIRAKPSGAFEQVDFYLGSQRIGQRLTSPFLLDWSLALPGRYTLSALVTAADGTSAMAPGVILEVPDPQRAESVISASAEDAEEDESDGTVSTTSTTLELACDEGAPQIVGIALPDRPAGGRLHHRRLPAIPLRRGEPAAGVADHRGRKHDLRATHHRCQLGPLATPTHERFRALGPRAVDLHPCARCPPAKPEPRAALPGARRPSRLADSRSRAALRHGKWRSQRGGLRRRPRSCARAGRRVRLSILAPAALGTGSAAGERSWNQRSPLVALGGCGESSDLLRISARVRRRARPAVAPRRAAPLPARATPAPASGLPGPRSVRRPAPS